MLRVDRILEVTQGEMASARVMITANDGLAAGRPLPGVILIEAMAQVAALFAEEDEAKESGVLAAFSGVRFHEPPRVGDLLLVRSRLVAEFGRLRRISGEAHRGDRLLASGEITIAI